MSDFYQVEEDGTVVVTTSTGWECECQPVADLLLRVGSNLLELEEPQPPTYIAHGVGGATETKTYDQEGIDDPSTPEEDKAAWADYLERKAAYDERAADNERKRNEMRGRFMALRGIKVRGMPENLDAWAQEQSLLFGLEIDENLPRDAALKLAFIDAEVVRTAQDGAKITAGMMRAQGMDQEALDTVEATFRDSLG
jgi:hypothetical protein